MFGDVLEPFSPTEYLFVVRLENVVRLQAHVLLIADTALFLQGSAEDQRVSFFRQQAAVAAESGGPRSRHRPRARAPASGSEEKPQGAVLFFFFLFSPNIRQKDQESGRLSPS